MFSDQEVIPRFKPWKTITLGLHKTSVAYRQALKAGSYRIGDYAYQILDKAPVAQTETKVDLVVLSNAELGYPENATRQQSYDKAFSWGLQLCPAEVGPALRLAYSNQPRDKWRWIAIELKMKLITALGGSSPWVSGPSHESLQIAMEPITDSDGNLKVFNVHSDIGMLWLDGSFGSLDFFWDADTRLVFVLPRK